MYSYFIICNTDDPNDFYIDMTTMKDYRLRFSAMKSNHIKRFGRCPPVSIHTGITQICQCQFDLPSYHNLLKKNYTYYLLEKRDIPSAEEALKFKNELIRRRSELFKDHSVTCQCNCQCQCDFTVTFP